VAGVLLLGEAQRAQAGAFAVREQSAEGLGESFAGVAAGAGGLSSMFWNPATMTQRDGWNSSWSASGILPYANMTPSATTIGTISALTGGFGSTGGSGNIGRDAVVPSSYSSYQVNDWLWIGYAFNAPYGLLDKTNYNWAGQVYGRTSQVHSIDVQPSLAIKLNEMISFGVGIQVERLSDRLTAAAPSTANPGTALLVGSPTGALDGHAWGVGFSAGATITPLQGTQIGIGYRSQISEHETGTLVQPPLAAPIGIRDNIMLPDEITVGLRQRISNEWNLLAGFEWTHWSLFNSFPVYATTQPAALYPAIGSVVQTLAFRYRDGWFTSFGAEYKWNSALTLRAGVGLEQSPIFETIRSARLPDQDRIYASIGASYKLTDKLSANLSYAHLFMGHSPVVILSPANPTFGPPPGLPFTAGVRSHIDLVAVGLNYRWDDPKVIADAPAALR
jgi:long-chain fatty acid transport protein